MYKSLIIQKKALTMFVVFALLFSNIVPAFAADSSGTPGQKPLNFVGAYLTQINNNTSTTGANVTSVSVPVKPLIKVVVDKNIANDAVWANNQKCVALQNSIGTNISANISRISDTVNFSERQNIFITPVNNLAPGGKYKIVVSPKLQAKNGFSTLGMTTDNQPVVVNFTVQGTAAVSVTGITLDKSSMTVTEGRAGTLSATVVPINAANKSVTWSSSNTAVAKVSQYGTVTAIAPGKAVITVKTVSGAKTANCTVTVKAAQIIYYVKSGDTLSKIAQIYGLTANDLKIANNFNTSSYLYVGQAVIIPTVTRIVQSGDTLYKIALQYGSSANAIMTANKLSSAGSIAIGQKLFIPVNLLVYTVKAGDTLWSAAQKYGTTESNLIRLNNLYTNKQLYIGQKLKINY